MKIGGVYILSRRSIARMIATITAALMSLYAAVSAQAQNTVRRIHDATISLVSLDRQMMGGVTRTVVPEIMYCEYKALYLELRKADDGGGGRPGGRGATALPLEANTQFSIHNSQLSNGLAARSTRAAATKADLRAAVKTILRGEDVNMSKPGPRLTPARRRQIEAAETYRKCHAGCTLHNACLRSFVPAKGGYKSAMALYSHMHESEKVRNSPC